MLLSSHSCKGAVIGTPLLLIQSSSTLCKLGVLTGKSQALSSATEDNVYFHGVRDQIPVGRAKNFQASQRNIINKAE